ncbi:Protein kinase-like domain containing protein [Elaphomyces granulatus]|jgi:serine/threonine protein kinase
MAEDAQRSLSIVPYSSNRDVVLRHHDSVVLLDRESQQLVLRNTANSNSDLYCPLCHRPISDRDITRDAPLNSPAQPEFVNPDYFRLLHESLPSSADSSSPPRPHRRLVQQVLADSPTTGSDGVRSSPAQGISSAAFSQGYFKKFFVEEDVLGRGGRGVVLLVKHVLDGVSLGHFACKRVPVGDDHKWLEKVLVEVQLLQRLSHQNLVSYRHVWLENTKLSTFGPTVPCAFILQQYCNAGDLHKYVYASAQTSTTPQQMKERLRRRSRGHPELPLGLTGPRRLQFEEIYSFFKDITSGLHFLHVNGYVHRDLKPSNCLLHETRQELRVLVSDFGEVQLENAVRRSSGTTGTVSYCAPEVLQREPPDGLFGNFTVKSDIFSLGMILYFLCFAQLPYRNADIHEEKEDLDKLRAEISEWQGFNDTQRMRPELPDKLYKTLKGLLSVDPTHRPTADDVLNDIQAGTIGNENRRFARASSAGPDFHRNGRIQPVDSPAPSPNRRSRSPTTKTLPKSTAPLRPSPLYEPTNATPDPETDSRLSRSLDRGLILRPQFRGSSSEPGVNEEGQQLIRPIRPLPPNRFSLQSLLYYLRSGALAQLPFPAAPLVLFLLKVISAFQPCAPLAANPWVFYPLLLFAAVALQNRNYKFQAVALVVHFTAVVISIKMDTLCIWNSRSPTTIAV